MHPAELLAQWPGGRHGAVVLRRSVAGPVERTQLGELSADERLPWASVTKLVVAMTTMVAVEEGLLGLDDPAGPQGSTVRQLLSHAAGLTLDERKIVAAPGTRRIYSNAGYEVLGDYLERWSGISIDELVERSVLVRDCSTWRSLDGCLRVTIGTPEENDRFLEALKEIA